MNIPKGHQTLMPYVIVKNANGFFDFAANVFDAKLSYPTERPTILTAIASCRSARAR